MTEQTQNDRAETVEPTTSTRRRPAAWKWRAVLRWTILTLLLWCVVSLSLSAYLTSRRTPHLIENVTLLADFTYEQMRLPTADGLEIGSWFFPGQKTQPVVLILHGNFSCRQNCQHHAQWLLEEGLGVMLVTLRAHGDSQGNTNDFGYSARHDVVAAVDWLKKQDPDRPVIVWGQSLGAAAAVFAAETLGSEVQGYLLECPYRDLETAVWNRCQMFFPSLLDGIVYLSLRASALLTLPYFDEISLVNSISKIPERVPVLIMAGEKDVHATPSEAVSLKNAIPGHARLLLVPEATHMGLDRNDQTAYRKTTIQFIQEACSELNFDEDQNN